MMLPCGNKKKLVVTRIHSELRENNTRVRENRSISNSINSVYFKLHFLFFVNKVLDHFLCTFLDCYNITKTNAFYLINIS